MRLLGFGQLHSVSQQLKMAFIVAELDIGLGNQPCRNATKFKMLGRMSPKEVFVLCAKS